MAAMTTIVKAIITADAAKMKKGLAEAETGLAKFSKKAKATGKKLTMSVTMPIVAIGGAALKSAVDFEASMTQIESLVGLSAEAVAGFTKDVKGLAGETARAPKELADAMFFITSAGLRGATATDTLAASAKAAAVGLGDAATIADLATSALNAYGAENLSATDATDVMVAAVREGKLEASELAGSMGRVLPIASAMGVQFNEVGAAFAALSRTGTNAAEAATQVRGIMASLLRPTKQAEEALTGMGLSSAGLRTQLKEQGLLATLKTLSEKFDGNSEAAASVFGNIRALSGVMDLMGANVKGTEAIFASMTDTTGALDRAFAITSETAAFKLQQAMSDVKLALVNIGEVLIPVIVPAIQKLAEWVSTVADKFANLSPFMQKTVLVVIGLVAALGPLLMIAGQVATIMGALAGTALAAAAGTIALTAGIVALVAIPLFLWWKSSSEAAADARDRQEELTASYLAAGDEATTLVTRTKEVVAAHKELVGPTEDATEAMDDFMGASVLASELIDKGVANSFYDLGIGAEVLEAALMTGSDAFQELEKQTKILGRTDEELIAQLRNAEPAVNDVTSALADQFEAGVITRKELEKMLDALDETADAHDDHRKMLAKEAEEYLNSTAALEDFSGILGTEVVASLIDGANETGNYADTVDYLRLLVENATDIEKDHIALIKAVQEEAAEADRVFDRWIPTVDDLTDSQLAGAEAARDEAAAIAEAKAEFDRMVDSIRSVVDEEFALQNAFDDLGAAQDSLAGFTKDLAEKGLTLGEVWGTQTELGRKARDEVEALTGENANLIASMLEAKEPVEAIAAAFVAQTDALADTLAGYGMGPAAIAQYIDALNLIPGEVGTQLRLSIMTQSITAGLNDLDASLLLNSLVGTGMLGANFGFGATGGIVSQPTLSLIGEAGPEAVIPLNQMPGASPLGSVGGMGGAVNVTVNVGGSVIGQDDLVETIQRELIRTKNRNGSLEF
jgi:TP901 family phage tail tape measure protein